MQQTPDVDILICSLFLFSLSECLRVSERFGRRRNALCSCEKQLSHLFPGLVPIAVEDGKWRLLHSLLDSLHGPQTFVANFHMLARPLRKVTGTLYWLVTLADNVITCVHITALGDNVWQPMHLCCPTCLVASLLRPWCKTYTLQMGTLLGLLVRCIRPHEVAMVHARRSDEQRLYLS